MDNIIHTLKKYNDFFIKDIDSFNLFFCLRKYINISIDLLNNHSEKENRPSLLEEYDISLIDLLDTSIYLCILDRDNRISIFIDKFLDNKYDLNISILMFVFIPKYYNNLIKLTIINDNLSVFPSLEESNKSNLKESSDLELDLDILDKSVKDSEFTSNNLDLNMNKNKNKNKGKNLHSSKDSSKKNKNKPKNNNNNNSNNAGFNIKLNDISNFFSNIGTKILNNCVISIFDENNEIGYKDIIDSETSILKSKIFPNKNNNSNLLDSYKKNENKSNNMGLFSHKNNSDNKLNLDKSISSLNSYNRNENTYKNNNSNNMGLFSHKNNNNNNINKNSKSNILSSNIKKFNKSNDNNIKK